MKPSFPSFFLDAFTPRELVRCQDADPGPTDARTAARASPGASNTVQNTVQMRLIIHTITVTLFARSFVRLFVCSFVRSFVLLVLVVVLVLVLVLVVVVVVAAAAAAAAVVVVWQHKACPIYYYFVFLCRICLLLKMNNQLLYLNGENAPTKIKQTFKFPFFKYIFRGFPHN